MMKDLEIRLLHTIIPNNKIGHGFSYITSTMFSQIRQSSTFVGEYRMFIDTYEVYGHVAINYNPVTKKFILNGER